MYVYIYTLYCICYTNTIIRIDKTETNIYNNTHRSSKNTYFPVAFHTPLSTKVLEAMRHNLAPQSLRTTIPGRSGRYYLGNSFAASNFPGDNLWERSYPGKLRWRSMNQSMWNIKMKSHKYIPCRYNIYIYTYCVDFGGSPYYIF